MRPRDVSDIDAAVGARIRLRRTELGISQQALAARLHITYQQLQKNEKGLNRIGAGRLFKLAGILGVPIDHFFQDVVPSNRHDGADETFLPMPAPLTADDIRLVRSFARIGVAKLRLRLQRRIAQLAGDADD